MSVIYGICAIVGAVCLVCAAIIVLVVGITEIRERDNAGRE